MQTKTLGRREAIGLLSAAGAALSLGVGDSPVPPPEAAAQTGAAGASSPACAVTPSETTGPFPSLTDLMRSDIRDGRSGANVTLTITVVNNANACSPLPNANVEIWQCDAEGNYSQYGTQTAQSYLRGIQTTNAAGQVTFTTIYPGWYRGRATHIHVEATVNGKVVKTTQIAFDESVNAAVYASGVYAPRGSNPTSNARDGIFADSLNEELATATGDPTAGYAAAFRLSVSA